MKTFVGESQDPSLRSLLAIAEQYPVPVPPVLSYLPEKLALRSVNSGTSPDAAVWMPHRFMMKRYLDTRNASLRDLLTRSIMRLCLYN